MSGDTKEATVQLEIRLRLPDSVAREAEASGLLEPDSLAGLLRDELRRRQVEHLFAAADRMAAVSSPPLTAEEVESEIRAVRAGRAAHADGR
jgi:hypothetical protein